MDEAGEEYFFDAPEVAEAVQWVVDLTHEHDAQPNPGKMSAADNEDL